MAEDFKYNRFEGMSPMRKAALILSEGMMAFGEGLSGKPFHSNYMERDSQNAKMAYEQWKTQREFPQTQAIKQGQVAESLRKQVELGVKTPEQAMAEYQQLMGNGAITAPTMSQQAPVAGSAPISSPVGGGMGMFPTSLQKKAAEQDIKSKGEVEASKRTSGYNLDLVAQNVYDLGDVLTKSWEEGGAGDLLKKGLTKAAQKGVVIGDAKTYKSSGALIGKRVELVAKMLPMLTQQIGKEGSVRLVESVFTKLGQTIPDEATPPELAKEQMRQSLLSMYRTRRALEQIDTSSLRGMSREQLDVFADEIAMKTAQIQMSPEEQKAFDDFANKALQPLNKYYMKKGMTHMIKDEYNALRSQGLSEKQVKERLGI